MLAHPSRRPASPAWRQARMGAGAEWPFVATIADGETETVRRVVARCSPPATGGGRWLADVVKLVGGTRCWRLQLGRLEPVVTMLREAWGGPGA